MGVLEGPNNRILKADTKIQDALEALRNFLDNINKTASLALRGPIYKGVDPKVVQTIKVDGVEFGYKVEDHVIFIRRIIYIKFPGYKVEEIGDPDRERIMTAVFNVFIVPGAGMPEIGQIAVDCLRITQDIVPLMLVERKPGLVSIAGGFAEGKPN